MKYLIPVKLSVKSSFYNTDDRAHTHVPSCKGTEGRSQTSLPCTSQRGSFAVRAPSSFRAFGSTGWAGKSQRKRTRDFVINTPMDWKEQRLAMASHMNKGCALCFHSTPQASWAAPTSSKAWGVAQPSWAAPCACHPHRQPQGLVQLPQHPFSLFLYLAVLIKATKVT